MRDLIQSYGIPLTQTAMPSSSTRRRRRPPRLPPRMGELGVQLIFARSPQAKGRVERTAGTLQDRLVSELWLAGATTIDDANREDFLPRFNSRFKVGTGVGSPTVPWTERCVSKGYCASSTGAESPETTLSDTAGAPCNCCPARTDRATPEQSSCAGSLEVEHEGLIASREAPLRTCCAASLGEPSTRLPLNSPTTWVEGMDR